MATGTGFLRKRTKNAATKRRKFAKNPIRASVAYRAIGFSDGNVAALVESGAALYDRRAILIGLSKKQRVLFTMFVELAEDSIRIMSARRATSHERKRYEEGDS